MKSPFHVDVQSQIPKRKNKFASKPAPRNNHSSSVIIRQRTKPTTAMRPITASKSPSNRPLVAGTFSNKKFRERSRTQSRGRSRQRSPSAERITEEFRAFDDDHGDDVIRSFSDDDGPDDIFDIQERYSGPTRGFSMGLIPGLASSEEDESRDDPADEEQSFDDDEAADSFSTESHDSSVEHENYLSNIMERFQIRDIFEGLQKSSSTRTLQRADPVPTTREDPKTTELKTRLQLEIQRSKELEDKLISSQKRYASQISEHQSRINALESKLAIQERIFARQLEAERQKRIRLQKERNGV